jgi:hypothetical protein
MYEQIAKEYLNDFSKIDISILKQIMAETSDLYNNDVYACVDIITNLLNPVISTP